MITGQSTWGLPWLRVSLLIREIEERTGLDFLERLPQGQQEALERDAEPLKNLCDFDEEVAWVGSRFHSW